MTEERKLNPEENHAAEDDAPVLQSRRDFLISLGKWSKVVIAGAILGSGLVATDRRAQAGGAWINNRGGYGGGGWVNRGGYGGGAWINNRGGYGGGAWVNNRGGYGGGWVNRGGGGAGWINR